MNDQLEQTELALQVLEKAPHPPIPDVASHIRSAAEAALAEGRTQAALENLAEPATILDAETAKEIYNGVFQPDSLDQKNNPTPSQEQENRKEVGTKHLDAATELAEKGYDKMDKDKKNLLRGALRDYLFHHPAFRAVAEARGKDLAKVGDFRDYCNEEAKKLLQNPELYPDIMRNIADVLATRGEIDYAQLQTLLNEQQAMAAQLAALGEEIKELENNIDTTADEIEKYQVELDDQGNLKKGEYAEQIENWTTEKTTKERQRGLYDQLIEDVKTQMGKIANNQTTFDPPFTYTDPETGKIERISDVKEFHSKLGYQLLNFQKESDKLQKEIDALSEKISIRQEGKIKAETELQRLQDEKDEKEEEKARLEESKTAKDEEVQTARKAVAEQEQALVEGIEQVLSETVTDLWEETAEAVRKKQEEGVPELEAQAYKQVKEGVQDTIYDATSKQFKQEELQALVQNILSNGVEGFGRSKIQEKINQYQASGTPEQKQLALILEQIRDDAEKLKEFSNKLSGELLRIAALKNPKMFEGIFTKDEIVMRSLREDVLPGLIQEAVKDPALKSELEQALKTKLTKQSLTEKLLSKRLQNLDWKKILKILLIILAASGLGLGGARVLPRVLP